MLVRPAFILREFVRVQREQWLSADELAERQWHRLQRLLSLAATRSPFYRRKFADAGLEPGDIRTRDDLQKIPVTTRDELEAANDVVVNNLRGTRLHESRSSGSTGQTVRTSFDDEAWLIGKYLLKARARLGCGVTPADRIALIKAGEFRNHRLEQLVLRQRSFSIHAPLENTLGALRKYSPTVLYGFPGHFAQLAQLGPDLDKVKCVLTSGEMLTDGLRQTIARAFDAPVYDIYGCTELKEIAWECPHRAGYHINADRVLVETLPAAGPGKPEGMLAVTSLYNFAMPLIRYQPGDTGRLLDTNCSCGRGLPMMAPGFGRSMDYFRLPDGRLISPYTLSGALENIAGLRQFQLVQETAEKIVARIVAEEQNVEREVAETLVPLAPGVRVVVEPVADIPREAGGKYRKAISLVSPGES